jgi:ADP-heptose:LPS heptosyltransferase
MKILIVQLGKIGDMALTTPLFKAIMEKIPHAKIHVLASHRGVVVIDNNPHVQKIFTFRKDPFRLPALLLQFLLGQYDVWIDPKDHFSTESSLLVRLCRPIMSVGFNKNGQKIFSHSLSTEAMPNQHVVNINMLALKPLGISKGPVTLPELFPEPSLQYAIRKRYLTEDKNTILLNISAGNSYRYWIKEKWAEIAGFLSKKGFRVLISCAPPDLALAKSIHEYEPSAQIFYSSSIKDIIALMPDIKLVITLDTSIVHIASAFNTPSIALFPGSDWNLTKYRPLSELSIVIQPDKEGEVASISVGEVEKAIESLVLKGVTIMKN